MILEGKGLDKNIYTDRKDFIIDFHKMKNQQQLVSVRPRTRFTDFPDHRHNYVEMIYMCQGSTEHLINGETKIDLKAGELLLLNQPVSHAIKKAGKEDIGVNILALPGFFDFAVRLSSEKSELSSFLLSTFYTDRREPLYIHYKVSDLLPAQNLIENIIWSLLFEQQVDEQISKLTMTTLLMTISRYSEHTLSEASDLQHVVTAEALSEAEEHYADPDLGRIARKHHVSVAYVSSSVKERTGKTFTEHLQAKRLELARELLLSTTLPVKEIAAVVGYNNTSYFYTLFNREYAMTPNAYRKKNEGKQTSSSPVNIQFD